MSQDGDLQDNGSAVKIVRDGESSLLFQEQTSCGMIEAILQSRGMKLNSKATQENATRFSSERFANEFSAYMGNVIKS